MENKRLSAQLEQGTCRGLGGGVWGGGATGYI